MGIELDVLTGHPEHDLLFVATQVARASGLKNPSASIGAFQGTEAGQRLKIKELDPLQLSYRDGRTLPCTTWLFDEARVYALLMRSNSPASEPFRKWVTEEVLPTIRKTGKYNAEESTYPIAIGVMDELKTLREGVSVLTGEVGELKSLIEILMARPLVVSESAPASVSTYLCPEVHTEFVWRHFDRKLLIKLCDMQKLSVPVADKLKAAVMVKLEVALLDLWNATDSRKLQTELSGSTKRPWARFPSGLLEEIHEPRRISVCMNRFKNPHY